MLMGAAWLAWAAPCPRPPHRPPSRRYAKAELIAENGALGPGENWVALRLVPDPGWHVYWVNPGDSGQTTEIDWTPAARPHRRQDRVAGLRMPSRSAT